MSAAEIAAKLTKAQREALMAFPDKTGQSAMPCTVKRDGDYVNWGSTPMALVRLGLFERTICNPVSLSSGSLYGPTLLGLAVRAELEKSNEG